MPSLVRALGIDRLGDDERRQLAEKLWDGFSDEDTLLPLHRLVRNDLRRALIPKTDYAIYNQVLPDRIEVVSVFHGSRDPEHWQERG